MTPWEFKGRELVNCSCEYGCPCQFNALPDKGHCYGLVGIIIDEGRYGDVRLDGLRIAMVFKWPGPFISATARRSPSSTSGRTRASARRC
jgi:hypothetical protein